MGSVAVVAAVAVQEGHKDLVVAFVQHKVPAESEGRCCKVHRTKGSVVASIVVEKPVGTHTLLAQVGLGPSAG
jgi:hypothetical protein